MTLVSSPQAHPRLQGARSSYSNTGKPPSDGDLPNLVVQPSVACHDDVSGILLEKETDDRSEKASRGPIEETRVEARSKDWSQQEEDTSYLNLDWDSNFINSSQQDQIQISNKAEPEKTSLPLPQRLGASFTGDNKRKQSNSAFTQKTLPDSLKDLSVKAQKPTSTRPRLLSQANKAETEADCSTWTGNHIEDHLSEQSIKNGLYDKTHVLNEANPAKPTITPHIKQQSTILLLSSLVVSVYEQRQSRGRVTASSTFKPPPRVTLTDTKREAWLRDLANKTIPLRRLSRTIPHGIRGKTLLDHCLEKAIPIRRAIWLAQCVGANEVRAFKRKGISEAISMNNELKWIRDWTVIVEQFIANLLESPGEANWKTRVTYGLQLSSNLYTAGLLDRDHFLDWHLQHIESASFDYVPLSLVMAQVYWADLLSSLCYCHRLVRICLQKLYEIRNSIEPDPFEPLSKRIKHILVEIVQLTPEGFVVPIGWPQYRPILASIKETSDWTVSTSILEIIKRNDRLHRALIPSETENKSLMSSILYLLKDLRKLSCVASTTSKCIAVTNDVESLIVMVLQWASSVYERGFMRAILGASIIRELISRGFETDSLIIAFLSSRKSNPGIDPRKLCYILVDLIMTNEFDAGKYLRWLIATGALNNCSANTLEYRIDTCLLREMPVDNIPQSQAKLRNSLLRGLSFPMGEDARALAILKELVLSEWREIPLKKVPSNSSCAMARHRSLVVTTALSRWIRNNLVASVDYTLLDKDAVEQGGSYDCTVDQVLFLRDVSETLRDYRTLAELIERAIPHSDIEMLMSSIKAIDTNAEELCAMGSFDRLFNFALDQYRNLRMKRPPLKDFPQAFLDMQNATTLDAVTITYLNHEIRLSDQITSVISFTPGSDIMMDGLQNTPSGLEEEIDAMISTSASNKKLVASNCFQMIAQEFEKQNYPYQTLIQLCMKLKAHDQGSFTEALRDWMGDLISTPQSSFETMLQTCIGASLDILTDVTRHLITKTEGLDGDGDHNVGTISARIIDAITADCNCDGVGDRIIALHYRNCQRQFCQTQGQMLQKLLLWAIKYCQDADGLTKILTNDLLLGCIRSNLIKTSTCLDNTLESSAERIEGAKCVKILVDKIADPHGWLGLSSLSVSAAINNLFANVDELSIAFYTLAIRSTVFSAMRSNPVEDVMKDVDDAIAVAMERDNNVWPSLLTGLDSRITQEVHSAFANNITRIFLQDHSSDSLEQTPKKDVTTALRVIDATNFALSGTSLPDIISSIVEAIRSIDKMYKTSTPGNTTLTMSEPGIHALLHLALIHVRKSQYATRDMGDLLQALCYLALSSEGQVSSDTTSLISDCIATIALGLDESKLDQISRSLGQVTQDRRIAFLCSVRHSPDKWLYARPTSAQSFTFSSSSASMVPDVSATNSRQYPHLQPAPTLASSVPFALRRWEVFPDSTPNVAANDTALSLRYFDARKVL